MYTVYDEMACQTLLETDNKQDAYQTAYNHQCVLMLDGKVIRDFSC